MPRQSKAKREAKAAAQERNKTIPGAATVHEVDQLDAFADMSLGPKPIIFDSASSAYAWCTPDHRGNRGFFIKSDMIPEGAAGSKRGLKFSSIRQVLLWFRAMDQLVQDQIHSCGHTPKALEQFEEEIRVDADDPNWLRELPEVLKNAVGQKVASDGAYMEKLVDTGDAELIFESEDQHLGTKCLGTRAILSKRKQWEPSGNLLGKALMEVRAYYRDDAGGQAALAAYKEDGGKW